MRTDLHASASEQVNEIFVVENPDGIYLAKVKSRLGFEAEGVTPEEAEAKVLELLQMERDAKESLHRLDIVPDPDEVVASDEE